MVEYLLTKEGLKSSDVSIIGIGVGKTAVAAIEQKQVDALVNMDPTITFLQDRGLIKILADTRTEADTIKIFGGEYPGAALYTTREFVDSYPDAAGGLARAIVKSLRWIHGKQPEEIAEALPDEYFAGDRQLYLKGLAASLAMFSPDGRFSEEVPPKVLRVLSLFDPQVAKANIDLSKTFTNRFVD
jgi:NitT/TauT family transport system substrate-binding protein